MPEKGDGPQRLEIHPTKFAGSKIVSSTNRFGCYIPTRVDKCYLPLIAFSMVTKQYGSKNGIQSRTAVAYLEAARWDLIGVDSDLYEWQQEPIWGAKEPSALLGKGRALILL
jgi:hypothetical protein